MMRRPESRASAGKPVAHGGRALLVGLDRETEPVPAGERGLARDALEELQRQGEPVGLLRVHRDGYARPRRGSGEIEQPRQQLGHARARAARSRSAGAAPRA